MRKISRPDEVVEAAATSHSQIGRKVSDEELRAKKLQLENLKQWDSSGQVVPLQEHDRAWRDLYDEAIHLGVTWESDEIVRIYLRSVDSTDIAHDLSALLKPDATEFPKSVVEASYWVATTLQRNKLIRMNRPTFAAGQRKDKASVVNHVMDERIGKGDGTFPVCSFCKKKHIGGAQECTRLKSLINDNEALVAKYLPNSGNRDRAGN